MSRLPNTARVRRAAIKFLRDLLSNPSLEWSVEYGPEVVVDPFVPNGGPQLRNLNGSGQVVISYWPKPGVFPAPGAGQVAALKVCP